VGTEKKAGGKGGVSTLKKSSRGDMTACLGVGVRTTGKRGPGTTSRERTGGAGEKIKSRGGVTAEHSLHLQHQEK